MPPATDRNGKGGGLGWQEGARDKVTSAFQQKKKTRVSGGQERVRGGGRSELLSTASAKAHG